MSIIDELKARPELIKSFDELKHHLQPIVREADIKRRIGKAGSVDNDPEPTSTSRQLRTIVRDAIPRDAV